MQRLLAIAVLLLLLPMVAAAQGVGPVPQNESAHAATPAWRGTADATIPGMAGQRPFQPPLRLDLVNKASALDGSLVALGDSRGHSVGIAVHAPARIFSSLRINSVSQADLAANCDRLDGDCRQQQETWLGGSLLGGYHGDNLLIDLGVGWMQHNARHATGPYWSLPATPSSHLMGIPSRWVDSMNRIEATGRLNLGDGNTHVAMGASIGRLHMLPGHDRWLMPAGARALPGVATGLESIDQTTISLGLGSGAISGQLVGRVMRPDMAGSSRYRLQPWSAVDFGITVRLPWEGELKLGAQNLWSSDDNRNLPESERNPIQGRIPYIRYHQNL